MKGYNYAIIHDIFKINIYSEKINYIFAIVILIK